MLGGLGLGLLHADRRKRELGVGTRQVVAARHAVVEAAGDDAADALDLGRGAPAQREALLRGEQAHELERRALLGFADGRRTCHCARSTCRSATCTRAARWPKIGTGSSREAWSCELASKMVRSPPEGARARSKGWGWRTRRRRRDPARAASASRCDAATRGPSLTMRSSSSSVTRSGQLGSGVEGEAKQERAKPLIQFLWGDIALGSRHVVDRGQEEQRDHERGDHAADDDERERALRLAADAGGDRHRQQAEQREQRGHQHRAQLFDAALDHRGRKGDAFAPSRLDRAHHQQAEERHLAEQRDEADDGAHRERHAAGQRPNTPAGEGERRGEQDRGRGAARLDRACRGAPAPRRAQSAR
jgi:hypothetical protein